MNCNVFPELRQGALDINKNIPIGTQEIMHNSCTVHVYRIIICLLWVHVASAERIQDTLLAIFKSMSYRARWEGKSKILYSGYISSTLANNQKT